MLATVVDVLARPAAFFADRDEPALRWPAAVVVGSAVTMSAFVLLIAVQFRNLADPDEFAVALVAIPAILLGVALVSWVLVTANLYAVSYPVRGRGGFRALLAYVGWGWLPQVVGTAVLAVAGAFVVSQLPPPTDKETARQFALQLDQGPLVALAAAAGTARATATGSFSQVQTVVGVGTALWSGYVWVAAIRQARGLTRRQALLAVAIPVLFMIIS